MDRLVSLTRSLPRWAMAVVAAGLLGVCWYVVFAAGGSRTAAPHVFYVPVVLAAAALGARAGAAAGLVAAVLCGPLMPLDVATGEAQHVGNWLTRGAFFILIGVLVGLAVSALHRSYRQAIQNRVEMDIALELVAGDTPVRQPETEAQVTDVLLHGRFHTVFQPIYRLDGGGLSAVEALTRFDTEPAEPPNVWFDRAHAVGLGERLELAAIECALQACRGDLDPNVPVSLNVSPDTLCSPDLVTILEAHSERRVILEVTEHAVIGDYDKIDQALPPLRQRRVRLAVDDAGAGFASFRHIVRLAPEIIKVDMSLSQDVRHDPVRSALADALVGFANKIGSDLVVEGIERHADLAAWRQLGASAAQGYLLARPGPLPIADRSQVIAERAPLASVARAR